MTGVLNRDAREKKSVAPYSISKKCNIGKKHEVRESGLEPFDREFVYLAVGDGN